MKANVQNKNNILYTHRALTSIDRAAAAAASLQLF